MLYVVNSKIVILIIECGSMKERQRTEDKTRFATVYTDEDFIKAVNECLEEATCTAGEVADRLGCNPRYAKNRLIELSEQEKPKIKKKMKGTAWGFRPSRKL